MAARPMKSEAIQILRGQILRGVGQSLGMVAGFVVVVAGAAVGLAPAEPEAPGASAYLSIVTEEVVAEDPELWLVDGFNVLNAAILQGAERKGFWRSESRERLLARAAAFPDPQHLCVVFDGEEPAADGGAGPQPVRVVFAPSADEWLLREVRRAPHPERVVLVTADRSLGDRARHAGARVVSPRDFLKRCGGEAPPSA